MLSFQGSSFPLGPSVPKTNQINFSVLAPHATMVHLYLFKNHLDTPSTTLPMHRSNDIWHIGIHHAGAKIIYAYMIEYQDGSHSDLLIDPYGKSLSSSSTWGHQCYREKTVRSVYTQETPFDWTSFYLTPPLSQLIIYEMHVRGFTKHPSSKVSHPGTFQGIQEKIPYFKKLGINTIELLPIHEFNETELDRINPYTGANLYNYWGYSTVSFFTIMNRYFTKPNAIKELQEMVDLCHQNDITVILDLVFNHTSTFSPLHTFDSDYYILSDRHHTNFTGCGNTLNAHYPPFKRLVIDSLHYLVDTFHIDGFRFDLASSLTRNERGESSFPHSVIEMIAADSILSEKILIAEPWDPGGLDHLGQFPPPFAEWNGAYRDIIKKFINSIDPNLHDVKRTLMGTLHKNRSAHQMINYISCHDGLSLYDLVSYKEKHNDANAENNLDGSDTNFSINFGKEGFHKKLFSIRKQQIYNFLLFLFVSPGVPMIQMGDEYGHTREGNNNPWCQDSTLNWTTWGHTNDELLYFCQQLIHWRKQHSIFQEQASLQEHIEWIDLDHTGALAYTLLYQTNPDRYFFIAFNPSSQPIQVSLPLTQTSWQVVINSTLPAQKNFQYTDISNERSLTILKHSSLLLQS